MSTNHEATYGPENIYMVNLTKFLDMPQTNISRTMVIWPVSVYFVLTWKTLLLRRPGVIVYRQCLQSQHRFPKLMLREPESVTRSCIFNLITIDTQKKLDLARTVNFWRHFCKKTKLPGFQPSTS